jgi:hypothetical protein
MVRPGRRRDVYRHVAVSACTVASDLSIVRSGASLPAGYPGRHAGARREFDSWSRSKAFSFQAGAGNVIKGWDQRWPGVEVGSRVQLDTPPSWRTETPRATRQMRHSIGAFLRQSG